MLLASLSENLATYCCTSGFSFVNFSNSFLSLKTYLLPASFRSFQLLAFSRVCAPLNVLLKRFMSSVVQPNFLSCSKVFSTASPIFSKAFLLPIGIASPSISAILIPFSSTGSFSISACFSLSMMEIFPLGIPQYRVFPSILNLSSYRLKFFPAVLITYLKVLLVYQSLL